jgi:hypothetical protein
MTPFGPSVRRVAEYASAWDAYEAETCKASMESAWDRVQSMWDDLTYKEQASVPEARRGMSRMKEGA